MSATIAKTTIPIVVILLLVAGVFIARRNLQLGRGDRRGALRLATFLYAAQMLAWLAGAHHTGDFQAEFGMFTGAVGRSLFLAVVLALLYLALEPYVRRRMPELLIGWARLLEGRYRDPRVGRDILVGALIGSLIALVVHVSNALPTWIPFTGQTPLPPNYDTLYGGRRLVSNLLTMPGNALGLAMITFGLYFLLRVLLKNSKLAVAGLMLFTTLTALGGENALLETPGAVVIGALLTLAIARFGLLAAVATVLFQGALTSLPLPIDLGLPYGTSSGVILVVLLAVVAYAFRISLGTQRVFAFDD